MMYDKAMPTHASVQTGRHVMPEINVESACVYDCRHPWWGGQGICSSQADPINYACLCDEGYITEDSDGNPACVPKIALVGIYATVAVVSFGVAGFLLWQAQEQSRLPTSSQLGRRVVLRLRVIVASRSALSSLLPLPLQRW